MNAQPSTFSYLSQSGAVQTIVETLDQAPQHQIYSIVDNAESLEYLFTVTSTSSFLNVSGTVAHARMLLDYGAEYVENALNNEVVHPNTYPLREQGNPYPYKYGIGFDLLEDTDVTASQVVMEWISYFLLRGLVVQAVDICIDRTFLQERFYTRQDPDPNFFNDQP